MPAKERPELLLGEMIDPAVLGPVLGAFVIAAGVERRDYLSIPLVQCRDKLVRSIDIFENAEQSTGGGCRQSREIGGAVEIQNDGSFVSASIEPGMRQQRERQRLPPR
jgi:hypothetical protein